jgi:hypothetical protein
MRVSLAVCASGISVDKFTNTPTLFGVIEVIPISSFPFWIPQIMYFVMVRRVDGEPNVVDAMLSVRLHQNEIFRSPMHFDFAQPGLNGISAIMMVQGIAIDRPGELEFVLILPGGEESIYRITIVTPPTQATTTSIAVGEGSAQSAPAPAANQAAPQPIA